MLRRVLEHRFKYLQPTVTCFIDFTAAFDSIDRAALWRMMERNSVPTKIIRLIKAFYEHTSVQICIYGELTDSFEIRTCVHQGCALSLNIQLCDRLDNGHCLSARSSPGHRITDLEYADAVVLFVDSYNEMQVIVNNVSETAARIGLWINVNKTKVFSSYVQEADKMPLFVNSLPVEEVSDFKYFGSTLIPNGQAKDDIITRITWIKSQDPIHLRSNTTCISNVITERRLRWLGHILRRPPQEFTHISLFAKSCDGWRQKRGGPIKTWTDTLKKDFECIGGPAIYGLRRWKKEWLPLLLTMASDRAAWKRLTLVA
ncbi:unnamed protein product [Dracunculus medinensis]|uniref:Reverse transcriptase domain-containing protein n=1 Tax=Dracunculus medinensis TaxID=318479 RepID=A0A0N4U426_DRAME|nr:unnamed protein product [Dracunculus medinensis]